MTDGSTPQNPPAQPQEWVRQLQRERIDRMTGLAIRWQQMQAEALAREPEDELIALDELLACPAESIQESAGPAGRARHATYRRPLWQHLAYRVRSWLT